MIQALVNQPYFCKLPINWPKKHKVFYFSSEESLEQVKQRASRILNVDSSLLFSDTGELENIISTCESQNPEVIIIDSIQ